MTETTQDLSEITDRMDDLAIDTAKSIADIAEDVPEGYTTADVVRYFSHKVMSELLDAHQSIGVVVKLKNQMTGGIFQ